MYKYIRITNKKVSTVLYLYLCIVRVFVLYLHEYFVHFEHIIILNNEFVCDIKTVDFDTKIDYEFMMNYKLT